MLRFTRQPNEIANDNCLDDHIEQVRVRAEDACNETQAILNAPTIEIEAHELTPSNNNALIGELISRMYGGK